MTISCIFYPLFHAKIVIMIHIACISKFNDDWHDGTISRSSRSHVTVNLVLSGIALPNSLLLFQFLRTALSKKSFIFTTCYFPVEAYRWFEFIISWRILFSHSLKVSNNEIICLRRIQKNIILFNEACFSTVFRQILAYKVINSAVKRIVNNYGKM